jgi:hypothetical protein
LFLPILQHLGPRWVARRAWLATERRLGLLAWRTPSRSWESFGAGLPPPKFVARLPVARRQPAAWAPWLERYDVAAGHGPVEEARAVLRDEFRIFSGAIVAANEPDRWSVNRLGGPAAPADRHWSRLTDAGPGDIKGVWELSRFSWAFALVRAWWRTGDDRLVEKFWVLLEEWRRCNPPHLGPQWMCGQEASFRLIALAFAEQALGEHPASTPARRAGLRLVAAVTAQRVRAHLGYALSQSNNHGIAEAVGLLTAGAFWPELPGAAEACAIGRRALTQQVADLVDADGAFSQHSTNYHRLLLQLLIWAELVERAQGRSLPASVRLAAARATKFLAGLMEADGTVPRYGADDGADLFPLSNASFEDFRPTVGTALALFVGERLAPGPWDEAALALLGPAPLTAVRLPAASVDHRAAGVAVLRHPRGTLFFRAPTVFRHRPSHADQLHVSLRWDGRWLAEDPGTFSYRASQDDDPSFAGARFHNVVMVGGRDPMRRASRFLWLPWRTCRRYPEGQAAALDGDRGERWARAVLRAPAGFVIVDRVTGAAAGEPITLRWHSRSRASLEALTIACSAASTEAWVTADPATGEGWHASRYGRREPAWVRRLTAAGPTVFFVTALGPRVRLESGDLLIDDLRHPLSADPGQAPCI